MSMTHVSLFTCFSFKIRKIHREKNVNNSKMLIVKTILKQTERKNSLFQARDLPKFKSDKKETI